MAKPNPSQRSPVLGWKRPQQPGVAPQGAAATLPASGCCPGPGVSGPPTQVPGLDLSPRGHGVPSGHKGQRRGKMFCCYRQKTAASPTRKNKNKQK